MLTKKHLYEDWPTPVSLCREKEGRAQLEQDTKEYLKMAVKSKSCRPMRASTAIRLTEAGCKTTGVAA